MAGTEVKGPSAAGKVGAKISYWVIRYRVNEGKLQTYQAPKGLCPTCENTLDAFLAFLERNYPANIYWRITSIRQEAY